MLTVVIKSENPALRKKIHLSKLNGIHIAEVGPDVPKRRLNRLIKGFGGRYTAADCFGHLTSASVLEPNALETLLFYQFAGYILSTDGTRQSIGIFDPLGRLTALDITECLVAHCAEVTVYSDKNMEAVFSRLLLSTGICPDAVSDRRALLSCDTVFAFNGFPEYLGLLFGKGGKAIDPEAIVIPKAFEPLLQKGIDPVELWCGLYSEGLISEHEGLTVI